VNTTWGVYAWRCHACQHLVSAHTLVKDGDLVAGPYQCHDCGCQIRQDAPMTPLSRYQYERYKQKLTDPG